MNLATTALLGVDFTSAPRKRKPITVAHGHVVGKTLLQLDGFEHFPDWTGFEALLARPGPWVGGFDFPFGLPREAVSDLGWPETWPALLGHCQALGRAAFRQALDRYRESRPAGRRYAHRATDMAAVSHSSLKLVNPPVGLMFLEGAPRLFAAGLSMPGLHAGDPRRIALEAYPGLLARSISRAPYKSDDPRKHSPAREATRHLIVEALAAGSHPLRLQLRGQDALLRQLVGNASGDLLDAVLALTEAAASMLAGPPSFGLPAEIDPLEGWIACAPLPPFSPLSAATAAACRQALP
ncbi:DUF429 domain-containing protein [Azoarcus indigens]|uniref:Uncharacterized protein n=1 Tax=Azoarcus indigens TaxID=29545 RepID=A0A4R6ECD5_9RHOO|nr:DUF429 domain-containing protein [Azoarcus indigens]TDN55816.1 hypothetical protein C7389_103153 [Azoarcus indigens]